MRCRMVGMILFMWNVSASGALPAGSSPAALELPHFPSRAHALVFRNWNLVETGRIAAVLGTTPQNLAAVAESMGLPPARAGARVRGRCR